MAKIYECLYCDAEKGAPDTAQHCDQRPQGPWFMWAHVWQVIRTSASADRREWELRYGSSTSAIE